MNKVDRNNVEDILPLTPTQAGMLFHTLNEPESGHYLAQLCLRLRGRLRMEAFETAWREMMAANEMLRVTFRWMESSEPVQIVLKEFRPNLRYLDLRQDDLGDALKLLDEIKARDLRTGLDLQCVPYRVSLFKLTADLYEVVLFYHNILLDGWSVAILVDELLTAYERSYQGMSPVRVEKARVKDFLKWRLEATPSDETEFWARYLAGVRPCPLVVEGSCQPDVALGPSRLTHRPPAERIERAKRYARDRRVTWSTVLYTTWAVLLARYTMANDVVFGTPVAGRPPQVPGIERAVGVFINTPPLRLFLDPDDHFEVVVGRVRRGLMERGSYEWTAASDILRAGGLEAGVELFNTILVIENYAVGSGHGKHGGLTVESYSFEEATHYDLTVIIREFDESILDFCYRRDRLRDASVARLAKHFVTLLNSCVERWDEPLWTHEMLSAAEREQVLVHFNATNRRPPRELTIVELFDEAVARHGDHVAIVCGEERLGYDDLQRRVNVLAAWLGALGVRVGSVVGLLVERSVEMVVAILGVLRAGGCYLPLSPFDPAARTEEMLNDSGAELLIVRGSVPDGISFSHPIVDLDALDLGDADGGSAKEDGSSRKIAGASSECSLLPSDSAYVIYTSGSTGGPKGVEVPHRAVVNLLHWLQRTYQLTRDDVVLQSTPITFDVSIWELFSGFVAGGRLCLLEPGGERDPAVIVAAIERHGVTSVHLVPSMMSGFLEHVEAHRRAGALASLRRVFASGEALRATVVERFWNVLGEHPKLRLFNHYGPTETTVWVSSYECGRDLAGPQIVAIGMPIDNTSFLVLGRGGVLMPVGTWGELHVAGTCLATGYRNRSELTAERFFYVAAASGRRVYRTGDIVRWLFDGNLEFRGRLDGQVKIRGHRVELGEVEYHLLAADNVQEAAVAAEEGPEGPELRAYYIARPPLEPEELRSFLSRRLPAAMIPARLVRVGSMPLKANGKVDACGLRSLEPALAAPVREMEEELGLQVISILSDVLRLPRQALGPDTNYFHLGCNSISVVRLISALFRRLGVQLSVAAVFDNPTPRRLTEVVRGAKRRTFHDIPRIEKREYYELSFDQKRLWIVQQLQAGTASYNLVGSLEIQHADPGSVRKTLDELLRRHESLRTRFVTVEGRPVQQIVHDAACARLVMEDLSHLAGPEQETALRRLKMRESAAPFDLRRPPLLRTILVKLDRGRWELVVNMPHIVADGWSLEVLKEDFEQIYSGKGVEKGPGSGIQYKDYAAWQNRLLRDEDSLHDAKAFWASVLAGGPPELDLPRDLPPTAAGGSKSAAYRVVVSTEVTRRLREWSQRRKSGLFLPQVVALQLTMAHITGQDDIVVGFTAAARQHESLERLTGMFANTLLLRSAVDRDQCLGDFCSAVQGQLTQALDYQSIPLELVCDQMQIRFPRLGAFLNFLNFDSRSWMPLTDCSAYHIPEVQESKFPLHYYVTEFSNGLEVVCDYDANRFAKETVEHKMEVFLHFLKQITGPLDRPLRSLARFGKPRLLLSRGRPSDRVSV